MCLVVKSSKQFRMGVVINGPIMSLYSTLNKFYFRTHIKVQKEHRMKLGELMTTPIPISILKISVHLL